MNNIDAMYNGRKISVGITAYNEAKGIRTVIKDFKSLGIIDEIVVVDNNSTDGTGDIARKEKVRVVVEKNQGYGYACMRALREFKGDIIILTEGDGSYEARDAYKLLAYIDDADMVVGTRTTRELLGRGAKMNFMLFWGNIFLAKLIQLRFWRRVRLTDVGHGYRAVCKKSLKGILGSLHAGGSDFSPHMMLVALKAGFRVVEIPVNYNERLGESKITSNNWKSFKLGIRMLRLILFS